jgi:hypothetical protein
MGDHQTGVQFMFLGNLCANHKKIVKIFRFLTIFHPQIDVL